MLYGNQHTQIHITISGRFQFSGRNLTFMYNGVCMFFMHTLHCNHINDNRLVDFFLLLFSIGKGLLVLK